MITLLFLIGIACSLTRYMLKLSAFMIVLLIAILVSAAFYLVKYVLIIVGIYILYRIFTDQGSQNEEV